MTTESDAYPFQFTFIMPTLLGIMFVLLIIGIIALISPRLRQPTTNSVAAISSQRIQVLASELGLRVKKVQGDFSDLERRYSMNNSQVNPTQQVCVASVQLGTRAALVQLRSTRSRRRRRFISPCPGYKIDALDTSRMSGAFISFCERLLATNHIWEQEKQIKKLQSDIRSAETARQVDSFHDLCNKLLLHNKMWQLERQVGNLGLEVTMLKRKLATIMKGAARKMTEEPKHERLIQGCAGDMTIAVGSCKLVLGTLNALQEIAWGWQQDCWGLDHEVGSLNLARQASFVEQDLQNEFEDSLYEGLRSAQRRMGVLETRLEGYQHTLADVPAGDEDETFTTSSLTCVSSESHGVNLPVRKSLARLSRMPMTPRNTRSARWVDHSKRQRLAWPKRLIIGDHTGFSFNPLFYGPNTSRQVLTSHQQLCDRHTPVIETTIREARRQARHARV